MHDMLITITHSGRGLIDSLPVRQPGDLLGHLATARYLASSFQQVYGGRCRVEIKA